MKNNLNRHKRMHKEKSLKCMYCDFWSSKKEQLEYHIDKKHQDVGGALSHMCSECGKGFIYKNVLTKHLWKCKRTCNIGNNQKMFQKPIWTCPICDNVLKNRDQFRNHMASLHQGEKPFRCLKCDTGFSGPDYLKRHKCPYDEIIEHVNTIGNVPKRKIITIRKEIESFVKHKPEALFYNSSVLATVMLKKHKLPIDHKLPSSKIRKILKELFV